MKNSFKNASASFFMIFLSVVVISCGDDSNPPPATPEISAGVCQGASVGGTFTGLSNDSPANVMDVEVGGLSICRNVNTPCTSVTVCIPGTTNCQKIDNILVDTGSYGLRIFSQAMIGNLCTGLPLVTDNSGRTVGECALFGSAADWGPVMNADVQLGSEPVVNTSIQVINRNFAPAPNGCASSDTSPQEAYFNGILGVGLKPQDCPDCATHNTEQYYGCAGGNCTGTLMPLSKQVQNPVALLTQDRDGYANNNGVALTLPSVPDGGNSSIAGTLYLGVATQANNTPDASVSVFNASTADDMETSIENSTACPTSAPCTSFIDSGSNAYYIPNEGLNIPTCSASSVAPGFYCPTSESTLAGQNKGTSANQTGAVTMVIANAVNQVTSSFQSFDNIGAPASGVFQDYVDLGLPFFLGKTVYVGIEGKQATFGSNPTGPYWAY
jgi:hypothetical protein